MKENEPFIYAKDFLDEIKTSVSTIQVPDEISEAVLAVCYCTGNVVTTGLGKAGHVARKCSSSLCSLGFPSCYLNPAEASHGDVGVLTVRDILVVFSTSGKTREILETIELARKLGVNKIISVTSHLDSPIRSKSDIVLDMGDVQEAGHLRLAPTTSVLVMLVISDMLTMAAAKVKGVSNAEFGLRHHGGYLGKKCRGEEA